MSHYLISEASRLVDEESHVLRYWEEELALKIPRNDLGHRYYTEVQLDIFRTIKELKQQGYQLREIKQYLEEMERDKPRRKEDEDAPASDSPPEEDVMEIPLILPPEEMADTETPSLLVKPSLSPADAMQQERMKEFRSLMTDILVEAMEVGFDRMSDSVSDRVSRRLIKEMNYLDREREEREEERFKELDEAIRSRQRKGKYKAEAAATLVREKGKKNRWKRKTQLVT